MLVKTAFMLKPLEDSIRFLVETAFMLILKRLTKQGEKGEDRLNDSINE